MTSRELANSILRDFAAAQVAVAPKAIEPPTPNLDNVSDGSPWWADGDKVKSAES